MLILAYWHYLSIAGSTTTDLSPLMYHYFLVMACCFNKYYISNIYIIFKIKTYLTSYDWRYTVRPNNDDRLFRRDAARHGGIANRLARA